VKHVCARRSMRRGVRRVVRRDPVERDTGLAGAERWQNPLGRERVPVAEKGNSGGVES